MSKTPSYKGLQPASEAASRAKRSNRSTDTLHEILLRRELWHMGLRFRKNVKTLPGKPDIVFIGAKVAVFCDGDFWHGRKWLSLLSNRQRQVCELTLAGHSDSEIGEWLDMKPSTVNAHRHKYKIRIRSYLKEMP